MKSRSKTKKRNFLDHFWNPTKGDVAGFRVLMMVSIPIAMLLAIAVGNVTGDAIWFNLAMGWLVLVIALYAIASKRYKKTKHR